MVTDDILYRRYLGGDEDSLSALMERHGDKLTLYLDGCLHDLHESEDLMIEAFAYLIAKQPRIRGGGFRAYLYRSARHMALRLLSRKRAQLCFSLDALTEEPEARELVEEAVESAERARILRACMAELHADYREALFLVYFEGLSHAETAAAVLPPFPRGGLSCGDPRSRAGDAVRHGALLRRGLLWRHDRQSVHRREPRLSFSGTAGLRARRVRDGAVRPPA